MLPTCGVIDAPFFDDDLRFPEALLDIAVQQFIFVLAICKRDADPILAGPCSA